jgi:purine-binding chemotaxis protein CheW
VQIVTFELAGHRFGLAADSVREIARAAAVTRLPKAPAIVEGVVNVRGLSVPVLDIRQRFGLPARPVWPDQHLIIALAGPRTVALRVDRAVDLLTAPDEAVEPAGSVAPGIEHVAGIVKLPDGLLVIHDLESFLSLDEAAQLDAAVPGPAPVRVDPPGPPPGATRRRDKR